MTHYFLYLFCVAIDMVRRLKRRRARTSLKSEIKQVERYEYLLVEYLKEMSSEIIYVLLIMGSLFLFVIIDLLPGAATNENYLFVKAIFVLLMCGGFALFGLSAITKRRIERRFEAMFTR